MNAKRIAAALLVAFVVGCGSDQKPVMPTKEYGPIEGDAEAPKPGKGKRPKAPDAQVGKEAKEG
jgi:hypothetical protein